MIMKKDGMAVWIARNFPHKHKKNLTKARFLYYYFKVME